MTTVPTLDDLADNPARAAGLPVEIIAGLLVKQAAVGNALGAALLASRLRNAEPSAAAPIDSDDT